jgi:hypothetical protein
MKKPIMLTDKYLEKLWQELADIQVDENDCILKKFKQFKKGAHKFEIWHWFDDNHSLGLVKGLMKGRP